jgi:hypothetical protein
MTNRTFHLAAALSCSILLTSCGGGRPEAPPADPAAAAEAPASYLQGLHASDLAKMARERGLVCQDPVQVRDMKHWVCQASTPLVSYTVEFYGKVPGRLEYIRAVVAQSGAPKLALATAFLKTFAAANYRGGDPAQARSFVDTHAAAGGQAMIGPASFKLAGDLSRVVLDIKAPGSEW